MNTYMAKAATVERKWYVVDAAGAPLGRLASQVAAILRGKNKPTFTPNVDCGDYVIIVNCDKVALTGKKMEKKLYTYHTGYIGGLKQTPYGEMIAKKSDVVVYEAVKGMLPKNTLGKQMLKKLRVYKGAEHKQQAQQPAELTLKY
ncbi:MAG: 50S ribosomal protein L13 [Clostridia bacterium]|nr:50S ribosomal protein L13 [Clostridia bacterium]